MPKIGTYKITNIITGGFYIGSSRQSINKRWSAHKSALRRNVHDNYNLQAAYNLYGKDAFIFEILAEYSVELILLEEQKLLDLYWGTVGCYNILPSVDAGNIKMVQTPESNAKRSAALKGRKLDNEHKQNIGIANRGKKRTDADKEKMRIQRVGRKLSAEHRKHIGEAAQGEKSVNAKLTNEQVLEIRKLYNPKTFSSRTLATMFDVKDKKTIMNIIHRKTWNTI